MTRYKLEKFLTSHSWMMYFGDGTCEISHSLLEKIAAAGVIADGMDIPAFCNALVKQAQPVMRRAMFAAGADIWAMEFFPTKLSFPVYYIVAKGKWYVTDVDVIT